MNKVAVLMTCHNRVDKTINCLKSFFKSDLPSDFDFKFFIVDDGSTDNTSQRIKEEFPEIKIINGNGSLFWAGGMRLSWRTAMQNNDFNYYLLLNDDVVLNKNFFKNLIKADIEARNIYLKPGIYIGSTSEIDKNLISYGGFLISKNFLKIKYKFIIPEKICQKCDVANANIMLVSSEVVKKIGILDDVYTHGLADFDYTLKANKHNIPVLVCPEFCGLCDNPFNSNIKKITKLKSRIKYFTNPLGLAFWEHCIFFYRHFRLYLPISIFYLLFKTFVPINYIKNKK